MASDNDEQQSGLPVFSYAGAPAGQSYEAWREEFCRLFCQLDVDPGVSDLIECTVEVTKIGSLSFGAAHGTAGSFLRTRSLLSDGCDDLVLVTAMAGDVLAVQHGRTVELRPGDVSLMSLDDIAECGLGEQSRFTALRIPRRELVGICRDAEDRLSKPITASAQLRDVVAGYFNLCAHTGSALGPVGQHAMSHHMTELVGLLLQAKGDETSIPLSDGYGAARLRLIQSQILNRLSDGNLTIHSVAKRAGLTPKQVQRLFGAVGLTFSEFVLEHRLILAKRMLCHPTGRLEKISTIAIDAGFRDLSYFNRSFRNHFGMSPSEWKDAQVICP